MKLTTPVKLRMDQAVPRLSSAVRQAVGRKVSIHHGAKKGRLELEYYSDEDLTGLLDLLEQLPRSGKGGAQT